MNVTRLLAMASTIALASAACGQTYPVSGSVVSEAFAGRKGALVLIELASGDEQVKV